MKKSELTCEHCPLLDCFPAHPGCLLKPKKSNKEEDLPFPVGLRIVARKLGVAYETVRFRIKNRQWHKLPKLFRTAPGGDWKCYPADLDEFICRMREGVA